LLPPSTLPVFMSVDEACRLVSLGRNRLYQLLKTGEVTAVKDGRRTLVSVKSLLARMEHLPREIGFDEQSATARKGLADKRDRRKLAAGS
jgi:excisionase family DNA binding protein